MKKPSDFHPDLNEDNIGRVAQQISKAYADAQTHRIPEKGDTRWALGCRRYEWAKHNLRTAVGTDGFAFLTMLEDVGRKFTMRIGDVPVKFKRTSPDNPDKSIFRQYEMESKQLSLLEFAGVKDPCELSWRVLVEDDFEGDVVRVVFVGADIEGRIKCFWELPKEKFLAPIELPSAKEEGVALPPAKASLKGAKKNDKKAQDE